MNKSERELLKRLAAAYAFIVDLRRVAIERIDQTYIRKTAGIEAAIEQLSSLYPRAFKRYFTLAQGKAHERQVKKEKAQGKATSKTSRRQSKEGSQGE